MTSLIEELVRDALDERVSVSTLLRKVRVAAVKLKLEDAQEWVAHELNGYEDAAIPKYRNLAGTVKYNTGYHGWQLLLGDTSNFNRRPNWDPIGQIESFLAAPDSKQFAMPFNRGMNEAMQKLTDGPPASYMLFVDRSQFAAVLSAVRNLVLDWALRLQQAGIVGDGMTFSPSEKQTAERQASSITIGSVGSITGNVGTANSIGSLTVKDISIEQARAVFDQIKSSARPLAEISGDPDEFRARLDALEHQLSLTSPSPSALRGAFTDMRSALSGAAGNLMATGAVALLNSVLGTGVPSA